MGSMATPPDPKTVERMQAFVSKYRKKSGTHAHPDDVVTESIVLGLAAHKDQLGRPLCPCNFYPDKKAELESSRQWVCACDEMKRYKYCHCLLFCGVDGKPITEYLPEGHEGRQIYGIVADPTPDKGREARHQISSDER